MSDWQIAIAVYFLVAGGFVAGGILVECLHDPEWLRTLSWPVAFVFFVFLIGWAFFPIAAVAIIMDARKIRRGAT
jgi:hypothetical protein